MNTKAKVIAGLALAAWVLRPASGGGLMATWGGAGDEAANTLALDPSTNAYIAGGFNGTVDFNPAGPAHASRTANGQDAFLCKYDKDGAFQWVRTWGSNGQDRANTVAVDAAGNAYVIGCFNAIVDFNPSGVPSNITANGQDAFLCKYDKDGTFQWARTWGGALGEDGYCLALDPSGCVYCVGDSDSTNLDFNPAGPNHDWHTNSFPAGFGYDGWLCKWAPDGAFQWARAWGGNGYDDCCAVAVDREGNVYAGGFLGSTSNTCDFNTNTNQPHVARILNAHAPGGAVTDAFLTKFSTEGVWQWATAWGSTNYDVCSGLCVDPMGNLYASGYFGLDLIHPNNSLLHDTVDFNPSGAASNFASNGAGDVYLCKYSRSGELQWVKTWGGANDEQPTHLAVDPSGCVYLSGVFKSAPCDFDPGPAVCNLSAYSVGTNDIVLSKFDSEGRLLLARACGGAGDDWGLSVAVDGTGNAYLAGNFRGTVDFGPLCGGPSAGSNGGSDAFLCRVPTCCRLTVVKSGNGVSSLGNASSVTQLISLGVTTQIVYSAADWYRVLNLWGNGIAVEEADGTKSYTQVFVHVSADVSNAVTFALATPAQTGYTNVPTDWLTNWAENAVVADPAFDVHDKYRIGLDPTTSNTFVLRIESFSVSGSNTIVVVKRTHTGGLSPDGMHGELKLQASEHLDDSFTNVTGTAVSGAAVFDATGCRIYSNVVSDTAHFIRAAIQ